MTLHALEWLEPSNDFSSAYRHACAETEPSLRLSHLRRLATRRLSLIETIQVARALPPGDSPDASALPRVRLAVLADANVDHLLPFVRVALLRHGVHAEVHLPAFGQYRQELMTPGSSLRQFRPDVVVFFPSARSILAGLEFDASESEAEQCVRRATDELTSLWGIAREQLGSEVVQQTVMDLSEPLFGSYDRLLAGSSVQSVARLNDSLASVARSSGAMLLDTAAAVSRDGIGAWFDPVRWHQAKQEVSLAAAPAYAELLARLLAARRGLSRKCLVLDLDNTLWGGVVGDDGVNGIVLGQGSARGEAHLAFQRYVARLKRRGIVLAVCSKNDPKIALEAFSTHPEMALKPDDIAVFVANWEDKAANIAGIAQRLNLGLQSLVFVDDSPAERARVREALPEVAVPEMPLDPSRYAECLAAAGYFEAIAYTPEDRGRAEHYRQDSERESLRQAATTLDDFLAGLNMQMLHSAFQPADLARVVQLINKTNQFNMTGRRHAAEFVEGIAQRSDCVTLQVRLSDRFGDNGLVAVMILLPEQGGDVLRIDTWVMSCRVFGRQLEFESMNVAVEAARNLGARQIIGEYVATPRNGSFRQLYQQLGFQAIADTDSAPGGIEQWQLDVGTYSPHATHVQRNMT